MTTISSSQHQDSALAGRASQSSQSMATESQLDHGGDSNHQIDSIATGDPTVQKKEPVRVMEMVEKSKSSSNSNAPKEAARNVTAIIDCNPIDRCESSE
ncbi:MAG: hypothetical protein JO142_05375 [Burkholderiales bacterium]|nr:hypothetical protein [Burkholderiales bacterium]